MLSDWGLKITHVDQSNIFTKDYNDQVMDVDGIANQTHERTEHREKLRKSNTFETFGALGKLTEHKKAIDESALLWYHGKEERQLELRCVSRIIPGQRTAIFKRYPRPEKEYKSFSLIYSDRSLDLICKDKDEAEVWFVGLKALISRGNLCHFKSEGRIESMTVNSPNAKRIYPSIPLEQGETQRVESLPLSRLGKVFTDIITYTAVTTEVQTQSENKVQTQLEKKNELQPENKVQPQSENKVQPQSSTKFQTQSEQVANYLSSPPSIAIESSNGRSSTAETFRVSLSSAVSSSSHVSYREDFEALGDVFIWREGIGNGVLGGGVHKIGSSVSNTIDAFLPKSLESTTVLDVYNIACGCKHAMLVTKQGEIFSWREEEGGRLGHGVEYDIPQPKRIDTLSGLNVEFVACGECHSCAVTFSGDLYTWGDGTYKSGLLGHGNSSSYYIPRKVYGLMDGIRISNISCGPWHTAVVTSSGQLYTFGDGTFGALGHGDHSSTGTPREVETLRGFRTIRAACGVWHTAAVVEVLEGEEEMCPLGKLFTWGSEDKGQLGHGDKKSRLLPKCVSSTDNASFYQVTCGHSLTAALTSSGRVYIMGKPLAGLTPTCIENIIGDYFIEEVACGSQHIVVLTAKNEVYTWGKGANGQLGHGDSNDRNTPTLVSFLKDKQVKKYSAVLTLPLLCLHKLATTADNSMCSGCRNLFNFRRKHHNCYNCGLVFCKVCTTLSSSVPKTISRTPSPVSKLTIATLAPISSLCTSDVSPGESKQKNERLSEEVAYLKKQVHDLKNRCLSLEAELEKKEEILKEATELAANEAEKCKAAKEVIKSLTTQLKEVSEKVSAKLSVKFTENVSANVFEKVSAKVSEKVLANVSEEVSEKVSVNVSANVFEKVSAKVSEKVSKKVSANVSEEVSENVPAKMSKKLSEKILEKMSERHTVNRRLESEARHGFADPDSSSSERNEASHNSPNSESTTNSSDSPLSNGKKGSKDKGEWAVQDEPGVYITLSYLGEGQHELKRVRFSRKRFTEEQAEK